MINTRLFNMGNKKQIYSIVVLQWISMVLNIMLIISLAYQLELMYLSESTQSSLSKTVFVFIFVIAGRFILKKIIAQKAHLASTNIKGLLRKLLYTKLLELGSSYTRILSTAEVMQVSTEGVDQLETYYGKYLPQFFYCMIAPLTLFFVVARIDFVSAIALFICVPLIPISIVIIQKIAKKLLSKYWGIYTELGDSFLENLQGLTTLKIYEADEFYHQEMNKNAEHFREITMKVLSMQLNSIIVMDTVAYGGSALGGILAVKALSSGNIDVMGAIIIILLASEFFLPMRALGSYFHIAMNGMSAADKMFKILDLEVDNDGKEKAPTNPESFKVENMSFKYTSIDGEDVNANTNILENISFSSGIGITAIVGKSGCGKSTIANILSARERDYQGNVLLNNIELKNINKQDLYNNLTFVNAHGYIFQGTIYDNLIMADNNNNLNKDDMIKALKKVNLWEFLDQEKGLETVLTERGSNLSGGQKQRLNLARALLRNSDIYIFDEVTSNIDPKSEDDIMRVIKELSQTKIVIIISHRLSNIVNANKIIVLEDGKISDIGTHKELLSKECYYKQIFKEQESLENYRK
ncbi:MAG: ABC transporter ATP-binding protein/permease [bacterium]